MTRDTRVQVAAALVLVVCTTFSGVLAINLTGMAGAAKLTYTDQAVEGQPIEQTVGIALGAFRGIFVNFLWIRANDMKEAGKFFEAIQLAETITKLQPRFPRVWVFHAWNMAYNISVTTQTPEERWAWVNAGIELLRDKGIPANPNDMLIHKELAWIFLHKIGGFTDDANGYYKRRLAQEWTAVLGPPPARSADDRDRAKAIKKYVDWLTVFDQAPLTMEDTIKAEPSVAELLDRIRKEVKVNPSSAEEVYFFLMTYERCRAILTASLRPEWEGILGPQSHALEALVQDKSMDKAFAALTAHWRHRLLVERYHMDTDRMIRYTQKYGPIDWRHHGAHALYWSQKGVEAGEDRWSLRNKMDFDFVNTDRVVAQAVQDLFRTGELYFDFLTSTLPGKEGERAFFQGVPNPHFVESYVYIVDAEMRQRSWVDQTQGPNGHIMTPLSSGYENFVRDAIVFFYRRGEMDIAQKWKDRLMTYINLNLNDPRRGAEIGVPLPEFVNNELQENMTRPSMMVSQVSGALMGAYASGLLGGDPDLFRAQFNFAKMAHRYFMEQQIRNTPAGGDVPRMEQIPQLFEEVAGKLFFTFMSSLDLDSAKQAYGAAPNDLRLYAYVPIVEHFKPLLVQSGPDGEKRFQEMFPEPEGYEAFVAKLKAEFQREVEQGKNQPAVVEHK